jgi:hypothetical protein
MQLSSNALICAIYLAGFFDGEGNLSAHHSKQGHYQFTLVFSQRSSDMLFAIQAATEEHWQLSGSIYMNGRSNGLRYSGNSACTLAIQLLPYVVYKLDQLAWFIETWQNRKPEGAYFNDKEYLRRRLEMRPRTDYT